MQTILVADDDIGDVELVKLLFKFSGIANPIQAACNGDQVIDYLTGRGMYADRQRHPYPLLCLLDLRMPRRSGFEVLEWLENHPEQTVEIVVLTGLRSDDRRIAETYGELPFLEKPFNFLKFQALLADHSQLGLRETGTGLVLERTTVIKRSRVSLDAAVEVS